MKQTCDVAALTRHLINFWEDFSEICLAELWHPAKAGRPGSTSVSVRKAKTKYLRPVAVRGMRTGIVGFRPTTWSGFRW